MAQAAVAVQPRARLEARLATGDVVVEAAQVGGVEVDAAVREDAAAVDLEHVVVGGQALEERLEDVLLEDVLRVDALEQRGAGVEVLERHRLEAADEVARGAGHARRLNPPASAPCASAPRAWPCRCASSRCACASPL